MGRFYSSKAFRERCGLLQTMKMDSEPLRDLVKLLHQIFLITNLIVFIFTIYVVPSAVCTLIEKFFCVEGA